MNDMNFSWLLIECITGVVIIERVKTTSKGKRDYKGTLLNIRHYLRRDNKAKEKGINTLHVSRHAKLTDQLFY